jgi:hypothetical protein
MFMRIFISSDMAIRPFDYPCTQNVASSEDMNSVEAGRIVFNVGNISKAGCFTNPDLFILSSGLTEASCAHSFSLLCKT